MRSRTNSSLSPSMPLCSIEGCNGKLKARGYCSMHHQRFIRHGDPLMKRKRGAESKASCSNPHCRKKTFQAGLCPRHYIESVRNADFNGKSPHEHCSYPGCKNSYKARGFCHKHYQQWVTFIKYFLDIHEHIEFFGQPVIILASNDPDLLHLFKKWRIADAFFKKSSVLYLQINGFLETFVHPEDVIRYRDGMERLLKGETVSIRSKANPTVYENERFLQSSAIPFLDEDKELIRVNIISYLAREATPPLVEHDGMNK